MKWFEKIGVQGTVIKLLFFLTYGGFASWMSYFYVYLKEGPQLSGLEIGIIAAFQQLNTIFVLPVWGYLADKYGRKRMIVTSLGISIFLVPMFLLSSSFWVILLFMIILTLFYNPLNTLLDTVALDFEEQSGGKVNYGQLRLWASVGWATFSVLTGFAINQDQLAYIFPLASGIFVVAWLIFYFIYRPLRITTSISKLKQTAMFDLIRGNRRLLRFMLLVFVYSIFSAPIYLIINLYYYEIGASNSQLGIAFAVQSLCELPLFFYGKHIVRRYGARNVFLFTMVATALRMVGYSFTTDPYIAIAIGGIHGISIALFLVSMVEYVHGMVPSHLRSTGQSLIYTFYAAGVCVGNFLIGFLNDVISIRKALLYEAIAILILVLAVLVVQRVARGARANT